MKQRNSKKYAVLTTVVCLVLCCAMTFGGTLAWFTDETGSANNIIASGVLDVELSYSDKFSGTYTDVEKTADPIFNYKLWEPGYTEVRYVQIKNAGNLAFEYFLNLTTDEEPTADGVKLSDVIEVYIGTSELTSRSDLTKMQYAGTLAELIADADSAAYGILLPAPGVGSDDVTLNPEDADIAQTGAATYCIALHMKEEAGNEYQNLTIGSGVAVSLYAQQYTYENDDFDNSYDENAGFPVADVKKSDLVDIIATLGMNNIPSAREMTLDTSFVFKTTETYEEAQQSPYRYWHADFVVSVDKDVAGESMALAGYYPAYCEDYNNNYWVALMSAETVKAGDEIRLLEAMLNGGSMSYQELCNWVPVFNCGAVSFSPDNIGTTLTVELRLYEVEKNTASTEDETGEYITIGTYTHTFVPGEPPVADVTTVPPTTITATLGMNNIKSAQDMTLDTEFVFKTTETYEEAQQSPYRYWHADFVVSADQNVPAESMALVGYYEAYCDVYNDGHWVALLSDVDIPAGTQIRLLDAMLDGGSMNYEELCNWVPVFRCGALDMTDENVNAGTTLTVELRLYETTADPNSTSGNKNIETGDYITIGTYTYTFK